MDENAGTRQTHAFEIIVGVAYGGIGATGLWRSYTRRHREAWQSIRLTSVATERL